MSRSYRDMLTDSKIDPGDDVVVIAIYRTETNKIKLASFPLKGQLDDFGQFSIEGSMNKEIFLNATGAQSWEQITDFYNNEKSLPSCDDTHFKWAVFHKNTWDYIMNKYNPNPEKDVVAKIQSLQDDIDNLPEKPTLMQLVGVSSELQFYNAYGIMSASNFMSPDLFTHLNLDTKEQMQSYLNSEGFRNRLENVISIMALYDACKTYGKTLKASVICDSLDTDLSDLHVLNIIQINQKIRKQLMDNGVDDTTLSEINEGREAMLSELGNALFEPFTMVKDFTL